MLLTCDSVMLDMFDGKGLEVGGCWSCCSQEAVQGSAGQASLSQHCAALLCGLSHKQCLQADRWILSMHSERISTYVAMQARPVPANVAMHFCAVSATSNSCMQRRGVAFGAHQASLSQHFAALLCGFSPKQCLHAVPAEPKSVIILMTIPVTYCHSPQTLPAHRRQVCAAAMLCLRAASAASKACEQTHKPLRHEVSKYWPTLRL